MSTQDLGHYAVSIQPPLITVEFMDATQGFPGTLVSNPFNPDGTDLKSRYGIDPGVNYQYIVGQYVGAHTRDRDHIAAPLLYKDALGLDSAGPWDIFDMNLVKGLTAKVIEEMNKKGLKTMDEQGGNISGGLSGVSNASSGAVTGSVPQTNLSAPASAPTLDLSAMLTSALAALLPALIQAEIARALPKGVTVPQAPSQLVQQPVQAPVQAPPSPSVAAVLSPLAAQAQSALNDLQHQVGEGGGHWAQVLRSLANAIVNMKQKYV